MRKVMIGLAFAAGTASLPAHAAEVLLDFNPANACGATPCGPDSVISPTFGSTAQLAVTFANFSDSGLLTGNFLTPNGNGAAFATGSNGGPEAFEINFAPAAGQEVSFTSLDLSRFGGSTATVELFNVLTGSFSSVVPLTTGQFTTVNVNSAFFTTPLRLRVTGFEGPLIDNVRLDVRPVGIAAAVPEPGTWAMMLFGFGAVGYSMRRRKVSYKALRVG